MSTFDPKAFGRKLRAAREEAELTQGELSQRSTVVGDGTQQRISVAYISALEVGRSKSRPSHAYLDAIARGLRHKDSWTVYEWAGIEKDPDWSTTLRAISRDPNLTPQRRKLMQDIYLIMAGQA